MVDVIVRYNDEDGLDLNANASLFNVVAENNRVVNLKLWRRPDDGYAEKVITIIVDGGLPASAIEENNLFSGRLLRFRPGPLSNIANPLFSDPAANDFRPQPGSPLVNGGQAIDYIEEDLDGTLRPLGGAWDIGAYEVQ